jgi:hypothetical protein
MAASESGDQGEFRRSPTGTLCGDPRQLARSNVSTCQDAAYTFSHHRHPALIQQLKHSPLLLDEYVDAGGLGVEVVSNGALDRHDRLRDLYGPHVVLSQLVPGGPGDVFAVVHAVQGVDKVSSVYRTMWTKDVNVVVYPDWHIDMECNVPPQLKEWSTILAEQDEILMKERHIDIVNDTTGTPVRNLALLL